MSNSYHYVKEVNPSVLRTEILSDPRILTAFDYITTEGEDLYIYMRAALSTEEEIALSEIVANHDPTIEPAEEPTVVKIQEETGTAFTNGHFQSSTFPIDVGEEVGWYEKTYTFPFNIGILNCDLLIDPEHVGNILEIVLAENVIVGTTTRSVENGNDIIYVSPSTYDRIDPGYYLSLTNDPTNPEGATNLGRVISKLSDGGLKVEIPSDKDFLFGEEYPTTYILQSIKVFDKWEFPGAGRIDIGDSKIGCSNIPANTPITIRYYNKNGGAKRFVVPCDYLY